MSAETVTVDFPQHLFRFMAGTFGLQYYDETFISRVGATRPTSSGPSFALWSVDLDIIPMVPRELNKWQARMARYIDKNLAFKIHDPFRVLPNGVGAGYDPSNPEVLYVGDDQVERSIATGVHWIGGNTHCAVYEDAKRYTNSIVLHGLPPSTDDIFSEGDGIEIGGNLYQVMSEGGTDDQGRIRIDISWKLWKPALAGDAVNLNNPSGRFVFVDTKALTVVRNPAYGSGANLVAIEFPYT